MRTTQRPSLREIRPGREALPAGLSMPRHRHFEAYALVCVAGALEQVSYAGRVRLREGEMLVQPTLDCHSNFTSGAQVLRLAWPTVTGLGGVYRLDDLDAIVRAAEHDADEASALAQAAAYATANCGARADDWPDLLAVDLAARHVGRLAAWARVKGLAPETVSRGFTRAYGVGPAQFARELRARSAWFELVRSRESLAAIAADSGFADQAHMTRSVKALTGVPPGAWRSNCSPRPSIFGRERGRG